MSTATTPAPRQTRSPAVPPPSVRHGQGLRREIRYDRITLAALGVLATVLSLWNLNGSPGYSEDGGTYTAQAFSVLQGNLAPYTYWYDHPPLGWIQLGALAWIPYVLGFGDGTYIGATRYVITVYFVATALLVFLIARRLHIRRALAALAVVILILSPLSLILGRQIYLDNIGAPWLLLAFYLVLSPRKALWHHIAAGACFAVAVLSKETLAIFGPALLMALLNRRGWSNRSFSVVGFLVVGGLFLSFYPLMALLRGELLAGPDHVSLQEALEYQFLSRSGSGYIWEAGSDRAELLNGWLYFDRYIIAAGIIASLVCLLRRRTRWIPLAILSFAAPVFIGQGYLPAMYIVGVLPYLILALAGALNAGWDLVEKRAAAGSASARPVFRGAGAAVIAAGVLLMSVPQWFEQDRTLLSGQANNDWRATLHWVQDNVPRQDTVLTPYSMWQDLNTAGWNDPWQMIVTEKADLDTQFAVEHPGGWRAIDWIVVGPIVRSNIETLDLNTVEEALKHAVPAATFGEWGVYRVDSTSVATVP